MSMLDAGPLAVSGLAVLVAGVASVLHWPRAPSLDAERWFKLMLATLLRGEVEQRGGSAADWAERVIAFVPYHPAGREPERKVGHPATAELPGAALAGERALLEALAKRPTHAARWAYLYDEDEAGLASRLDDPEDLGAAYEPATALGPGASWDALAAVGAGDHGLLDAALSKLGAVWVTLSAPRDGVPDVLTALHALVPGALAFAANDDALGASLAAIEASSLVLVTEGDGAQPVIAALGASPPLRDRVAAVVLVGPVVGGTPARDDWFTAHFAHAALDTELVRLTPYFGVAWLDRGDASLGGAGVALHHQRLPEPAGRGLSDDFVQSVDLGVLPLRDDLPVGQVARALALFVACWVRVNRA